MTTTQPTDIKAALQQIAELTASGCDIVRVAVPHQDDADALKIIAAKSQIPVIADIHFQPKYVFAAIDAGCAAVRVNPGNIRDPEKLREVVRAAGEKKIPVRAGANGGSLGIKPFIGFATHTTEEPYHKFTFQKIADTPYKGKTTGGWIALVQHYFISAWIPDAGQENSYEMLKSSTSQNIGRFTTPTLSVAPNTSGSFGAGFYAGPKDQYRLRDISPGLDLTVDYGWLWWIAQPLFALLYFFATGQLHIAGWEMSLGTGIGNWGVAIILLTVLVKLAFFHLSATSYKSMAKMRKLQPKMLELKERFGEDRQKLSQETMDLYRKEKVNPLGGCLPILIQMPVFLSLYWVLLESVELRHAPFMAWIHDLSVMDPYYVLPLLMGASMFFQQKLNPAPPDPIQAKVFQFMPIIFTVFFLFFPAGLVLYWLVNNVLSITQQWIITRQIERVS
mgnify:CR=1 FL=1